MIRVTWKEPSARHFECTFTDLGGKECTEIREGVAAAAVNAELEAEVNGGAISAVVGVEPFDFAAWRKRAQKATVDVIAQAPADGSRTFRSGVWADLKSYLVFLFRGKCAYCESPFTAVAFGDVEHYRPKGKVTELGGAEVDHPGYYWLAYEPINLLPSCQLCNQGHGKMNQFPIAPESTRLRGPTDPPDSELPLLLNPYEPDFDWRAHFEFETVQSGKEPGLIKARSKRGDASIQAYRLMRKELNKCRKDRQSLIMPAVVLAVGRSTPIAVQTRRLEEEQAPYAAASISEIEEWVRVMLRP